MLFSYGDAYRLKVKKETVPQPGLTGWSFQISVKYSSKPLYWHLWFIWHSASLIWQRLPRNWSELWKPAAGPLILWPHRGISQQLASLNKFKGTLLVLLGSGIPENSDVLGSPLGQLCLSGTSMFISLRLHQRLSLSQTIIFAFFIIVEGKEISWHSR